MSAAAIAQPVASPRFVLAEVFERADECTSAGGEHYALRLLDGSGRFAHAGGHARHLGLSPPGLQLRFELAPVTDSFDPHAAPPTVTAAPQPQFVVELTADPIPAMAPEAWCAWRLTTLVTVRAERVVPVPSTDAGRALIQWMARADRWIDPTEE